MAARSVARLTATSATPGTAPTTRSTQRTHAAQLMPLTRTPTRRVAIGVEPSVENALVH